MKFITRTFDNYNLHLFKTKQFKTINIRFNFRKNLEKKDIILGNLLSRVLIMASKKYENRQEIEKKCEELFDLNMIIDGAKFGNYLCLNADISFLNETYTEKNMNIESIKFALDILFNPLVINESFDDDIVSIVKNSFKEEVLSVKENATTLGILNMHRAMDKDAIVSYHPLFMLDYLDTVDGKILYNYYLDIINNTELDIYLLGNYDENIVSQLSNLNIGKKNNDSKEYVVSYDNFRDKENIVLENSHFNQGKLSIVFKLKDLTDFERKYVLYAYSFILGGTAGSILFKKVRLEHSLCYYINSSYNYLYNLLEIMSGINSENFEQVISLIKEGLNDLKNGNFTLSELENAKKTYLNALDDIIDTPFGIIKSYLSHDCYNADLIDDKRKNILKVTKEDIMNISNKIIIDTIYLLKEENSGKEEI